MVVLMKLVLGRDEDPVIGCGRINTTELFTHRRGLDRGSRE